MVKIGSRISSREAESRATSRGAGEPKQYRGDREALPSLTLRFAHEQENERKIAIQADTLNAVVLALKCRGTDHGKRMKGVAQGLLQASKVYSCFTKQEQNAIENILGRV